MLLEDNCEALELEDESTSSKELLLSETKLLEDWFSFELEDESFAELELAVSGSSGNFKVQEINV
jgi:hypothetical protein